MNDNNTNFCKKAYRWSLLMYYGVFILALVSAGIGYTFQGCTEALSKSAETIISSIAYIYLLASVPFALWYFSKVVSKLGNVSDDELRYKAYMKVVALRISLVAVSFVIDVLLFYLLHSFSFLYAAGIAAVALIFCKPKEEDIALALSKDDSEEQFTEDK